MAGEGGIGGVGGLLGGAIGAIVDWGVSKIKPTSEEEFIARQQARVAGLPPQPGLAEPWRGVRTTGTLWRPGAEFYPPPQEFGVAPWVAAGAIEAFRNWRPPRTDLTHPMLHGAFSPSTGTALGGVGPWEPAQPLGTLPGTPGAPAPPPQPDVAPPTDWRDYVELAGRLVLELWQRVYAARRARDLQRLQNRALQAYFDRMFRSVATRLAASGLTRGVPPVDLLQLSAGQYGGMSSLYGGNGYGTGWGGLVAGLGSAAGSIIRSLTGREEEGLAQYGDPWGPNILYPQSERAGAAITAALAQGCGSPFTAGGAALRPSTFAMANPASGKLTWFRPAGRPVLWSSDFAACRRVRKVASKARRRTGGR